MPGWKHKIELKQHLSDDETPEACKAARDAIVADLKEFKATVDLLNTFARDDMTNAILYAIEELLMDGEFAGDDVENFNDWMDSIYDWGDCYRVWIGGTRKATA